MTIMDSYALRMIYSTDSSLVENFPKYVSIVENKKDIYKTIDFANKMNLSITIRGSGTNLCGNATTKDIVLDISKYNSIIDVDLNKGIVRVKSGVILDDLNNFLKRYNKYFPVIPSSHSIATIGGMIACNCAGHNASFYGKMKEWVNSVNLIHLSKNEKIEEKVLGNDIAGCEGAFGVIDEVELRIIDIPKESKKIALISESLDNALDFFFKLLKDKNIKEEIYSIEYLDSLSINKSAGIKAIINDKFFNNFNINKSVIFVVEILSLEKLEDLVEKINKELKEYTISMFDIDSSQKIWNIREEMFAILGSKGYKIIEDPKLPLKKEIFKNFIDFTQKNKIPTYGHILSGIFHLNFKKTQEDKIHEMLSFTKKLGGHVSGEHGVGKFKLKHIKQEDVEFYCNNFFDLKKNLDSKNIFNPFIFNFGDENEY